MSEYGQELRELAFGCPSGMPVAQKLMAKINEAAGKFDALQRSHDALLDACKGWLLGLQGHLTPRERKLIAQTRAAIAEATKEGGSNEF